MPQPLSFGFHHRPLRGPGRLGVPELAEPITKLPPIANGPSGIDIVNTCASELASYTSRRPFSPSRITTWLPSAVTPTDSGDPPVEMFAATVLVAVSITATAPASGMAANTRSPEGRTATPTGVLLSRTWAATVLLVRSSTAT